MTGDRRQLRKWDRSKNYVGHIARGRLKEQPKVHRTMQFRRPLFVRSKKESLVEEYEEGFGIRAFMYLVQADDVGVMKQKMLNVL